MVNHPQVLPPHRSQMINWILEVTHNFKQNENTFFLAVSLLDRSFKERSGLSLEPNLHLAGITSMWIASKVEEVRPLKLGVLCRVIGHGKFGEALLKQSEKEMIKSVGYRITDSPTVWHFVQIHLTRANKFY